MPGAAIPGVLAPTIFFLGLNGVFGNLIELRGFDANSYASFIIPVSMLQGAGFTGAATGVNLARDIEQGWFDRLLASPPALGAARRLVHLGRRASADAGDRPAHSPPSRLALHWPGSPASAWRPGVVMVMATVAAAWGTSPGAQVPDPVGGAADAGGDDGADPDDHGLRAAGAADRLALRTVARYNP